MLKTHLGNGNFVVNFSAFSHLGTKSEVGWAQNQEKHKGNRVKVEATH